jgi:CYTH domain-containing protein
MSGLEIERKLLVRLVSDPALAPGARTLQLEQAYLTDTASETRRIRRTVEGGSERFHLNAKREVRPGVRGEDEEEIDAATYAALLAESDPGRQTVRKTRYAVPHDGYIWEIDVFAGPLAGLVVAEVEHATVEELELELEPPPCLVVLRDVTDDRCYTNAALARLDAPPSD